MSVFCVLLKLDCYCCCWLFKAQNSCLYTVLHLRLTYWRHVPFSTCITSCIITDNPFAQNGDASLRRLGSSASSFKLYFYLQTVCVFISSGMNVTLHPMSPMCKVKRSSLCVNVTLQQLNPMCKVKRSSGENSKPH